MTLRSGRPRRRASSSALCMPRSASSVARTTLTGLLEPSDFDRMSRMPAASTTARTEPPAMTPVPCEAGLSSTLEAPKACETSCGIVVPTMGTLIRFFFASSTPLRIASGTSPALPRPAPTWPAPSPTTTIALKLKRRPPLTTLATRLICTTRSSSVSRAGSILGKTFSSVALEVEAGFATGIGERPDTTVVAISGAVEDDLLDARALGALGQQSANDLGVLGLVAGRRADALLERRGAGQRAAGGVVDDLGVDLVQAAIDSQAGARAAAGEREADARVALRTSSLAAGHDSHFLPPILPALPALRRITSPA